MNGEIGGVVFGVKQNIAFVGGSSAGMKVDEYIGLDEGFLEIDISHQVGGAAVLVTGKELADVFAIDARHAFAEFEAGAVDNRHDDDVASHYGRIRFFDEVEQREGADDFATVDGALHQECRTRLRPSQQVYGYVQFQSGARRRRLKITECLFSGLCRNIADS